MEQLKQKWKEMDWLRRGLIAVLAAMTVGFGLAGFVAAQQKGVEYRGALLRLQKDGEVCRYSGRAEGRPAEFTVYPDGTVVAGWGDYTYGPYQVEEDPSASNAGSGLPGVEIRRGEEILFRGGYVRSSELGIVLIPGDGENELSLFERFGVRAGPGTVYVNGRELSEEERNRPDLTILAQLVLGPVLTWKGSLPMYLLAAAVSVGEIACIWFSEALFRRRVQQVMKNPGAAEPSDWYREEERLGWIAVTVMAAVFYCAGLMMIN